MLAFMDAEYNSDRDYKEKRADQSLIEVALIITDDKAMNVVDSYHSYVVPQLHDGKLYKRISKMTGIRQEDVDSGISFARSIEDMYSLVKKYEVKNIFTYGDDESAFRWNRKQYGDVAYSKKFLKCLKDVSKPLQDLCNVRYSLSLNLFADLCGTKTRVTHSASDDAETLREVYMSVMEGKYDREKCDAFNRHAANRERYYKIRENIRVMEQAGMKKEEILEMLKEEKAFPKFLEDGKK